MDFWFLVNSLINSFLFLVNSLVNSFLFLVNQVLVLFQCACTHTYTLAQIW